MAHEIRKPDAVQTFNLGHFEAGVLAAALSEYAERHAGAMAETACAFSHVLGTEGLFTLTKTLPTD